MKNRNMNIELIRIFSMMMIVYHHFSVHSQWVVPGYISKKMILIQIVGSFGKIGVTLFILITGYYFAQQNFSVSKIFKLNNLGRFYGVICYVLYLLFKSNANTENYFYKMLFPAEFSLYWFLTAYIILCFLQPLFKECLRKINRFAALKYTSYLIGAVYFPTILGTFFQVENIYYVPNIVVYFIVFALVGHLLREYREELLGRFFPIVLLFFFCSMLLIMLKPFFLIVLKNVSFPGFFLTGNESLNSLVFSISFFLIMLKIPINGLWIGKISSQMFDIYLIHDNPLIRNILWIELFKNRLLFDNKYFIFIVLFEPFLVFIVCLFFSYIRPFIERVVNLLKWNIIAVTKLK